MSKTANKIGQICTDEEFERFRSFHELLTQLIEKHELPSKKFDQLFEYVNDFETQIVPIAKKVGIDLSRHDGPIGEIWEQLGFLADPYDTKGISFPGDEYGEAAANYVYEQEHRLRACEDAVADLDKVMVNLYASQPKNTETIEPHPGLMIAAFKNALERVKAEHAGQGNERLIIGWMFKKTSRFILTVIVTIIATVIAAIVVDIFADFGWLERIKAFLYRIF